MTRLRWGLVVALRSVLVALIAGAALLAAGVLLAPATGHRVVVLRSGSMAPAMPVGSLAIIESIEPYEVRAGDVVTVVLDSGTLLTHRVVREMSLDGHPALVLHGDANAATAIEVVSLDRLAGRVVSVVPVAGYATWWLTQPAGLAASVALIGLLLVVIGALGRQARRPRRRHRRFWQALRRGPFGAQAVALERGVRLGLDKPALALLLTLVLAVGSGAMLKSAAIFTTSAGVGDNTFTTGTWPASDYRSTATGPWSDAATWQRYNGIAWVSATRAPSSIDGVVTIRSEDVVTVTADVAVDQVVVAAGGQLTVSGGVVIAIEDGTGTDVDISGTLDAVGALTVDPGADVAIGSGGVLRDSGTIDGSGSITARSGTIQANGAARTIANPINLNPALTVAGSDDLGLEGALAGTGTLVKAGTGTLTLSGANTYTGVTTVSAGTVALGITNGIGSSSAVTVAAGAILDLDGYSDTIGSLAGAGSLTSTAAGAVTLSAGGNNTSTTFSGVLSDGSGQVALTKAGTGTLTLSGANTYTGVTTVSAGILSIAADSGLGTAPASPTAGQLTIGTATLTTTATFTLNANRGIALTGTGTFSSTATTLTYGGIVAGTLTKAGTGTLTLSGANTYTGVTTVSAGIVRVQGATALGTAAGGTTVASGAAIEIDGSGLAIAEPVTSLIGTGVSAGGALRNLANGNTWSGALTLGSGGATVSSDGGTVTLGAVGGAGLTLTVTGAGNTTIGGVIATTTGTLVKAGTGTLTLSGANTYTGVTTVSAGRLNVNGSTGAGAMTIAAGATLSGSGTIGGTVSVSGTLLPGSSPGRLTNGALTFVANSTYSIEIGGTTPATQYDQDRVSSGAVTIGSNVTLSVVAIGGFAPTVGQTFLILDKVAAGTITGTFAGLAEGGTITNFLGSGLRAQITYVNGTNDVMLTVIP